MDPRPFLLFELGKMERYGSEKIKTTSKRSLLFIIAFLTFFLSAILDNLTTTIVMVSLLRKLIKDHDTRLFYVGIVVIAANSGGAWSPIGDVTTTMLWIGGQISAGNIILKTFLPSLISLLVPLAILSFQLKGKAERPFLATETYQHFKYHILPHFRKLRICIYNTSSIMWADDEL